MSEVRFLENPLGIDRTRIPNRDRAMLIPPTDYRYRREEPGNLERDKGGLGENTTMLLTRPTIIIRGRCPGGTTEMSDQQLDCQI